MTARTDDDGWMTRALQLARRCTPSDRAFSVGAVVVDADGNELAAGYSRETDPTVHAEEAALAKLLGAAGRLEASRLAAATAYTTLEPCSRRASRPRGCAQLLLDAGVGRVVYAWREPDTFVADARGADLLAEAGVEVVELTAYAASARAINAHLPLPDGS